MRTRAFAWTVAALLLAPLAGCSEDDITGPVTIVQIQLSSGNCSILVVGGTCQLVVTVLGSDGEVVEDPRLHWVSENIVFATVSASGVVTGVGAGTATIRAETQSGSVSDEVTIVVRTADDDPPPI
jgi:uncharacterized protein YjdB